MTEEPALLQPTSPELSGPNRFGVSLGIAIGVCGVFLYSVSYAGSKVPLPSSGWAAAFLFLAVESDVRSLRLPNWLTIGGLALALALGFAEAGLDGLGYAAAGAGIALGILFLPLAFRWIGAGDVKAIMALGALWGGHHVAPVIFWMFAAGATIAIGLLTVRGELPGMLTRWVRGIWITLSTRRPTYFAPDPGSTASGGLPFAVAIGIGASIYQIWGFPWS